MIGKRVAWDSNFTIKSLEKEGMNKEHDPFITFPFVHLKKMRMEDIDNLILNIKIMNRMITEWCGKY